jgi:hypothetical protein
LLIIDCRQMRTVSLQAVSIGTTGRLDFFVTNDLAQIGTAQPAYPIGGAAAVTTTTAAGSWQIPTNGFAFMRIRLGVATTAGTTTLAAFASQTAHPLPAPTTQPVSGTVTANQGTMVALPAGTNAIGDVGMQVRANSTGAMTGHHIVAAATTNVAQIKATAGRVYGWCLSNTTASWRYVKLHNVASATAGAAVAQTIGIPPNDKAVCSFPVGIAFATAISRSVVTGSADTDATATAAGDVVGDIYFA